jgi:thiol peroxidase
MRGLSAVRGCEFNRIAELLAVRNNDAAQDSGDRTRAAVAMILHQTINDVEILFIQRAAHDLDPWSGHIAFPGGKLEEGELECQAACRETHEEIGVDLEQGRYLGRLSDIVGANLPVRVSCCLFGVDRMSFRPVLNEEVCDLFWVTLSDLRDQGRHLQSSVAFDEKRFQVPAIRLPVDDKPLLWGITYRLVMQLLALLEGNSATGEGYYRLPEMVELNEEDYIMSEKTGIITFKGSPMTLLGPELKVGDAAPDFAVVDNGLAAVSLSSYAGKIKIISAVPSLDTPVCDTETRRFNQEAASLPGNVIVLTVSLDLPFAQKRWCGAAGIDKVVTLSDYRERSFGLGYGVLIKELLLLTRAVFVVDATNTIRYIQIVPEVTGEPDYAAAVAAAKALL